jgi:hypothetical protein
MKRMPCLSAVSFTVISITAAGPVFAQRGAEVPADANYRFAQGQRLVAGGKPIDVTTGHASPYVYDFNGDGKRDLLVGEFGSGVFRGETTTDNSVVNARLRIYLNTGTNDLPRYGSFKYLQGGGENASVPST